MRSPESKPGEQARPLNGVPGAPATPEAPHNPQSRRVELLISNLLRTGVALSLCLIVCGTAIMYVHHPEYLHHSTGPQRYLTASATFPHSVRDVWHGLVAFRGQAVMTLGLLMLIATPVMRVAISILGFVYEGDRPYVVITSIVLLLLILSFALGAVEHH
jgi:uncharacterized membrane protein